jgi:molybdopterin converting factor small subunit
MSITVEFFGIPRERAGASSATVEAAQLGKLFHALALRFPRLAEVCFEGDRLRPGYIANLNGERFISDPATSLADGDAVLILSADAGG